MRYVNLIPRILTIHCEDGVTITIPASKHQLKCEVTRILVSTFDNIPVYKNHYGSIEGLPPFDPNKFYIVVPEILKAAQQHHSPIADRMVTPGEAILQFFPSTEYYACKGLLG